VSVSQPDPEPRGRKRLLVGVLIACAGLMAAGVLLWSNRPSSSEVPARILESARVAHRVFDQMPTAPVTSTEAVVRTLDEAPLIPDQPFAVDPPAPPVRRQLFVRIAEWLRLRHEGDPDAYADWARSRACELTLQREDAERFPGLELEARQRVYEYHEDAPLPDTMSPIDYFKWSFQTSLAFNDGLLRPAAIAGGQSGARVLFKRVPAGKAVAPLLPDEEADLWNSGWGAGSSLHWAPPILLSELHDRDGEILVAFVQMAILSVEDDWVPTTMLAYWAPTYEDWYFSLVNYSNTEKYNSWYDI